MRALLDVSVLIALFDADHTFHRGATLWFSTHGKGGWASCPITQNGCIRIMSHSAYPNRIPMAAIMERLSEAARNTKHEFWADDVSLLSKDLVSFDHILGPRQLTDTYLLALSVHHHGTFVTFDTSISTRAVLGATKKHLTLIDS